MSIRIRKPKDLQVTFRLVAQYCPHDRARLTAMEVFCNLEHSRVTGLIASQSRSIVKWMRGWEGTMADRLRKELAWAERRA